MYADDHSHCFSKDHVAYETVPSVLQLLLIFDGSVVPDVTLSGIYIQVVFDLCRGMLSHCITIFMYTISLNSCNT